MTQPSTHNHERTCISCGTKASKVDLFRIVRTSDGLAFDPSGKAAGRGAYVCSVDCFNKVHTGRLAHALKTNVSEDQALAVAQALQAYMQTA